MHRRGYDLVAFSSAGAKYCTGLEISPSAAAAANTYIRSQGVTEDQGVVVEGDFFAYSDTDGPFDVGFDYT